MDQALRWADLEVEVPEDVHSDQPVDVLVCEREDREPKLGVVTSSTVQKINSVHPSYRPERWAHRNHYVFWFHDTTFECIAEGFEVELHDCSMPELLSKACARLVR